MTGTTARSKSRDVDAWRGWLSQGGKVWADLVRVLIHRDIWKETRRVLGDSDGLPDSYFWKYLLDTYLDSQVIAVRRLTDNTGDTQSLRRILEELNRKPQHITLSEWTQHSGVSHHDWVRTFGDR